MPGKRFPWQNPDQARTSYNGRIILQDCLGIQLFIQTRVLDKASFETLRFFFPASLDSCLRPYNLATGLSF